LASYSASERLALIRVRSIGTLDDPFLSVEIKPDGFFAKDDDTSIEGFIVRLFNLKLVYVAPPLPRPLRL
jgi:hypothetical protein